jgi:choline-sulfatase
MPWRRLGAVLAAVFLLAAPVRAQPVQPPSVVFLLLDTTRADHFGSWGYEGDTTPVLDALARRGVRFVHHYANSHATRPSMPQLLSGRYYHNNILAPFLADAHPREMSFARPDPSSILLPQWLGQAGYATQGVSAHTWVAPDSDLGRTFDHVELLPFGPHEAHGDATPLVDRALAAWGARDRSRPLFLYVHFMDMHIPRRLPDAEPRHPVPGYDWHARFRPNGEPAFGRARRDWSRYDASDFTPEDRAHYAAVYDTRLHHADAEIGRLLAAIEVDDPGLRNTIVVVTADHGEELGEDGRIEHPPSLADAVQHVPWIIAGGPVEPGQECEGMTEHVDVLPSLAAVLGRDLPPAVRVDGTSRMNGGHVARPCGGRAVFHAWEEYRAIRTPHYLLVERPPDRIEARCDGPEHLYRVDGIRRHLLTHATRRLAHLHRALDDRLDSLERTYRLTRYEAPHHPFLVRADYFGLDPDMPLRCVVMGEDTPRALLLAPGFFATGRGLALTAPGTARSVIRVEVPSASYAVEAATTPIPPAPWLFGVRRWRHRAFGSDAPSEYVALGTHDGVNGEVRVELPADVLLQHHLLGLRLTPAGAAASGPSPSLDPRQRERLRALGYVQ